MNTAYKIADGYRDRVIRVQKKILEWDINPRKSAKSAVEKKLVVQKALAHLLLDIIRSRKKHPRLAYIGSLIIYRKFAVAIKQYNALHYLARSSLAANAG